MSKHQILLVRKLADKWSKDFDWKVEELDKQIGTVDTNCNINNITEVLSIEKTEIIPFAKWERKNPFLTPFSFLAVIN